MAETPAGALRPEAEGPTQGASAAAPPLATARGRWRVGGDGRIAAVRQVDSSHRDPRPADATIDLLVVHHISLPPGRFGGDAIERLFTGTLDPGAHPSFEALAGVRVSAHFVVRRDGRVTQYVSCDERAWHAGLSNFLGRERCNDFSIGVELEGTGEVPYTARQYAALARLSRCLADRYPLRWIAGHSDIAPGRKTDPGPSFDWSRLLREHGLTRLARPF